MNELIAYIGFRESSEDYVSSYLIKLRDLGRGSVSISTNKLSMDNIETQTWELQDTPNAGENDMNWYNFLRNVSQTFRGESNVLVSDISSGDERRGKVQKALQELASEGRGEGSVVVHLL